MVKPCLIELQFLLKISHSYFFNLDRVIVYWRSIEVSWILWRVVVRSKFLLPSVLVVSKINGEIFFNCFEIFTGVLSPTVHCLDGRIWHQSCSLFPENSWTLSIFLVTRFLNSSLLISICWYFWGIVGDRCED